MSFMVSSASDITNRSNRATDNPLSLKKAIKDYQDELFTGLTEDERKEIEAKINDFIKERTKDKNYNKESFKTELDSFIKGLLKEYGFKGGDTFEDFLSSGMKSTPEQISPDTNIISSSNTAADILMNVQSPDSGAKNKITTQSEMVTDSDGFDHLVVSTPNGLYMKIKMETGQEISNTNPQTNNAVSDYDKNIEYFFDEKNTLELSS